MAATIRPEEVREWLLGMVKHMPVDRHDTDVFNDALAYFWLAAPWRWTLGSLTPVKLVADTQDYTIAPPTDYLYLHSAYITNGDQTHDLHIEPIHPAQMKLKGLPTACSITGTTLRVFPPPGTLSSTDWWVVPTYKKKAPKLTRADFTTAGALIIDDEYVPILREGMLWRAYMYADDPRAGTSAVTSKGDMQFNGQRGAFQAGIEMLKLSEPMVSPTRHTSSKVS